MDESIVIRSVFIFMCLWTLSLLFVWFRSGISIIWKTASTAVFGFYCWFFRSEILSGFRNFCSTWYISLLDFFSEFTDLIFCSLFFLWPLSLFLCFIKADDIGSEKLMKFMCIFTAVLWLLFLVRFNFGDELRNFFYVTLREMVPFAE